MSLASTYLRVANLPRRSCDAPPGRPGRGSRPRRRAARAPRARPPSWPRAGASP